MSKSKLKQHAVYLYWDQHERFIRLSATKRIPRSALLREAVRDLLAKYRARDEVKRSE